MSGTGARKLAEREGFGCVYECGCGTVHIAIGPVELKLTREGIAQVHAMLCEATELWDHESRETYLSGKCGAAAQHFRTH